MATKKDVLKYVEMMAAKKRKELNKGTENPTDIMNEVVSEMIPEDICTPIVEIDMYTVLRHLNVDNNMYDELKEYVKVSHWNNTITLTDSFVKEVNEKVKLRMKKAIIKNIEIRDSVARFDKKIAEFNLNALIHNGGELAQMAKDVLGNE